MAPGETTAFCRTPVRATGFDADPKGSDEVAADGQSEAKDSASCGYADRSVGVERYGKSRPGGAT